MNKHVNLTEGIDIVCLPDFENIENMIAHDKYFKTISQIESLDSTIIDDDESDEEIELTDESEDGSNKVESVIKNP